MLNIYINTWGNYNEHGADLGEWVTLPMEPEELEAKLEEVAARMNDRDPEWFINDYEWTGEIELGNVDENDGIYFWNNCCIFADSLDEYERKEVAAAMDAFGYSFEEAAEKQRDGQFTFYADTTLEEVAEEIVNDCYNLPDFALRYFDYEAFARDLSFDGYSETEWGVICE